MSDYTPEAYWSRVAVGIQERGPSYVAGNDDPYYVYKRDRFLKRFLSTVDFNDKVVLELGCGPGGNLEYISRHQYPLRLIGVDVSQNMLTLAAGNLRHVENVTLQKINGTSLPFTDKSIDISFTVTVLHHNTNADMFTSIVAELCRVSRVAVIVMEDIGPSDSLGGYGDWIGRKVSVYNAVFAGNGYALRRTQFLDTKISRTWHRFVLGMYRQVFARRHHEGDKMALWARLFMSLPLPVTRIGDDMFPDDGDLAKLEFRRK
jgi:SAM-dependent methyltransferase